MISDESKLKKISNRILGGKVKGTFFIVIFTVIVLFFLLKDWAVEIGYLSYDSKGNWLLTTKNNFVYYLLIKNDSSVLFESFNHKTVTVWGIRVNDNTILVDSIKKYD